MKFILLIIVIITLFFTFTKDTFAAESSFKCTPTTGTYLVGSTFTVDYVLDSRSSAVYGADVEATYDTGILEATSTQSTPNITNTIWSQPVTNTIDNILGKITLEYGKSQPLFTGSSSLGQVTFRAKTPGQAQFNFTFFQQYDDTTPGVAKVWGKRDGTNITNILTDINNCIYVIEGSTPTTSPLLPSPTLPPGLPTNTPVPPAIVSQPPRAGSFESTIISLGLAGFLLTIGTSTIIVLERKGR